MFSFARGHRRIFGVLEQSPHKRHRWLVHAWTRHFSTCFRPCSNAFRPAQVNSNVRRGADGLVMMANWVEEFFQDYVEAFRSKSRAFEHLSFVQRAVR